MTHVLINQTNECSYALVDTKSHASKNSKVAMSKLLGGVISVVLTLLDLDYEIDQS